MAVAQTYDIDYQQIISDLVYEREVDEMTVKNIFIETWESVLKKKYGDNGQFNIIFNSVSNDLEVYHIIPIVSDNEGYDEINHMIISQAKSFDSDFEIGDDFIERIDLKKLERRYIDIFKQIFVTNLTKQKHRIKFEQYEPLIGTILNPKVTRIRKDQCTLALEDGTKCILYRGQQLARDRFKEGQTITALLQEIKINPGDNSFVLVLDRKSPEVVSSYLNEFGSEKWSSEVKIQQVIRLPGVLSLVLVSSLYDDDRVDVIGSCNRRLTKTSERFSRYFQGEELFYIKHTTNNLLLMKRALDLNMNYDILTTDEGYQIVLPVSEFVKISKKQNNILKTLEQYLNCHLEYITLDEE